MKSKLMLSAAIFCCASAMSFAAESAATAPVAATTAAAEPASALVDTEINTLFKEPALKDALSKFSLEAGVGFETEYVFRGRSETGPSINPAVNIGYDLGYGFAISGGYWGNYNVTDSATKCNEADFDVAVSYTIENVTLDFGYVAYTYVDGGNTHEFKVGASYDTVDFLGDFNVSPYIAAYYDITLSGKTLEGGFSYSAPVTKWINGSTWGTLDFAAYLGYTYGNISFDDADEAFFDGYCYAGFSFGGTVTVTEFCAFSAGLRYAYCNDYTENGPTNSRLWFGTALTFGF